MGAYDQCFAAAQRTLALATAGRGRRSWQALANQRLGTAYLGPG